MAHVCEKYISLMQVELDDLDAHIEALMCETLERWRKDALAEHVCLANLAVLRREKHAIQHFKGVLTRLRAQECSDVDELVKTMKKIFQEETTRFDLSPAACRFALHNMERIKEYVLHSHWSEAKRAYMNAVPVQ